MLNVRTLGQGQDLVFLHGWGMNSVVWDEIAAILATEFRVTLIDLPGHGNSQWLDSIVTLDEWTTACLEVAPPTAQWIGWSLGGTIALNAALQASQRVQGLIMVTATPCFLSNEHWPYGLTEATLIKFREMMTTGDWHTTLGHFLALQIHGSTSAIPVLRKLRRQIVTLPRPNTQALAIGLNLLRDTDLSKQLINLKPPSLWLYGERDTLVPQRSSELLAQNLPSAQTVVIPGAAHAPFISHQTTALDLLRKFTGS